LLNLSHRILVCEKSFVCYQKLINKCSTLYLRGWRLWPRRSCGFAYVTVLAGTSERLAGLRVLEETCRCCGIKWSCRIIIMEILHCGEGGEVKQLTRTSKKFPCVCDFLSLSLYSLVLYILHAHNVYIFICLILIVLNWYTCLIESIVPTLVWIKRAIEAPQLLIKKNLEKKF